ncbi:MAG: phosphoribosylamine--glycine ligase [Bacteroidetes bacterium]|nr:MAG: phosphoribosylamine--glycine ligase [Bacteroidota bacterium]
MNILLLGSGGREHALAWKIAQSPLLDHLFIAPGNAGTASIGTNINLKINDFIAIKEFIIDMKIDMLIVGPEQPLVDGIYDFIKADSQIKDTAIIGMSKQGAMLEGSKDFAKEFMMKYNVPTAAYQSFNSENIEEGKKFLETLKAPYVLKADGLAGGKGVLILDDIEEAKKGLSDMLLSGKFGKAGSNVVIEEYLDGIELSVFILTDGTDYVILPEAKDYKRIGEGDTGLNTGGMGSISPVPFADKEFMQKVEERIIKPTVKGIKVEGMDYTGFVFIGLMNVGGDPYVIEYNVRMGDPETESVVPRIKNDLLEIFKQLDEGRLSEAKMEIDSRYVASVMLVAGGYPESYEKGKKISGLETVDGNIIFHAGTTMDEFGVVYTNGGRIMTITSFGEDLQTALYKSYATAKNVKFNKMYYRTDLGKDLI